jgi:hypothetical protein
MTCLLHPRRLGSATRDSGACGTSCLLHQPYGMSNFFDVPSELRVRSYSTAKEKELKT